MSLSINPAIIIMSAQDEHNSLKRRENIIALEALNFNCVVSGTAGSPITIQRVHDPKQ